MQKKYLDLTSLQAGDILLTSSNSFASRLIVWAQRFWHLQFGGPGFSHAIIVISPLVRFDTTGANGARFSRHMPSKISQDAQGHVQLWLDVSEYKNIAVIRYGKPLDSHSLLLAAALENTASYPRVGAFLSLVHPSIKAVWHRISRRWLKSRKAQEQKFCSSLAAYLLQKVDAGHPLQQSDWSAMSPFKLYDSQREQTVAVAERSPDSFSDTIECVSFLALAQAHAGANSMVNIDAFFHQSEDLMKHLAGSSIFKGFALDPQFIVEFEGEQISLLDKPYLSQVPHLASQIKDTAVLLERLKNNQRCYATCQEGCRNSATCFNDTKAQMAKMGMGTLL